MRCPTLVAALLLVVNAGPARGEALAAGDGRFPFSAWDGPAIEVWYHAPANLSPATPVVFVMHGMVRNGDEYRDQWSDLAAKYGFLLLVPTFSNANFPGFEGYNYGNVIGADGRQRPRSQWAFTAIERLFDRVKTTTGITAPKYFF